jgi:mannan endo-1,4-beta-mannosidase
MKVVAFFLFSTLCFASGRSPEAEQLLLKLKIISTSFQDDQKIILGHQNAFIQGRGWTKNNQDLGSDFKSDMQMASGIHPMMYGLDFLEIGHWNEDLIVEQVQKLHQMGGITTLSWHMKNLVNQESSWNTSGQVVSKILPGGTHHQAFKDEIKRLAHFLLRLKPAPVIFRPFHEHNRAWFWWGKQHSSKTDFLKMWKFLVDELKAHGVDHLLYAYSPSYITSDYFERYPGDDKIDILGVDTYFQNTAVDTWWFGSDPLGKWKKDVLWLVEEASKRKKIPAITEFGQEGVTYKNFWTDYMGWPLEKAGLSQITNKLPEYGIAYILLWRNDPTDPKHFFGPTVGNSNQQNFMDLLSKDIYLGL